MNRNWIRRALCPLLLLALSCSALSAAKVERTAALSTAAVSDGLRSAVEGQGYRVTLDDGWSAEFWFARQLRTEKKDAADALYPEISDGELIGIVNFPQGFSDYRGQSVPAGTYTLRYQLLPQDGNHLGVAPNPDFLLAIPAEADSRPEQAYPFTKLVALSAKSTGGAHPAVMALAAPGNAGTVVKNDNGDVVFTAEVPTTAGKEKLAIVIKGTAAQ